MAKPGPRTNGLTRQRVRDAAARLFWRNGYAATSTRELSEAIGIQKASLYHHIGSKEQLLYELCMDSLEKMKSGVERAVEDEEDPVECIRKFVATHLTFLLDDRDKHATMLTEMRSLSPKMRKEVLEARTSYEHLVRDMLAAAQRSGDLRKDLSASVLALALFDLLNWSIFWYEPRRGLGRDELAQSFTAVFLDGAAADSK